MMSRPELDALLLVTCPGGARSFNYDDYWSRGELFYTGHWQASVDARALL
jgi:hypothetical protein